MKDVKPAPPMNRNQALSWFRDASSWSKIHNPKQVHGITRKSGMT